MKELIQLEGDQIARKIPLEKSQYTLGRGAENDIVFDVVKVSRWHASLIEEDDSYYIIDQNSKNYVFVNGQKVQKKRLVSGDRINLSQDISLLYLSEEKADQQFIHMLSNVWNIIEQKDFLQLQKIANRIISLDSLDQILNVILTNAISLVKAERGFLALTDEDGEFLDTHVNHNIALDKDGDRFHFSHSIMKRAIRKRDRVFFNVSTEEGDLSNSIHQLNLKSVMCHPLFFADKLVGILYVDSQNSSFDEIDQFFFTILSDYAAIAIQNATLYNQVQMSNRELMAEVEESEMRYRQLVEFSPEAIAVHKEGKILYVNTAAVKMLGAKTPDDLVGTPVFDRVHPDFVDMVMQRVSMENEGLTVPPLEEKFLRLDGSAVDVEVVGVPFVYEGRAASMAIFREITRRKRMEQELLRAQKLESVGVLAGGIAHDFNNILQVIRGNALMAKANMDDKDNVELCLTAIEKAVRHAASLTSQLLTFSKGGTPVTKATSIQELIEESVAFALRGSNVAYTLDFSENLYFVEADSDQINQVIHNLVLNADQAMPNGGTVTILACNVEIEKTRRNHMGLEEGAYVKISIRDEGMGIHEDILQKVFDPYFTTKQEGSGLGLASCYSIVTKHGGIIEAESEAGKGSTFMVYLPASGKQPIKHETGEWSYKLDAKVLFMDDDAMVRDTAGRMLQRLGCCVESARDGTEAVELYLAAKEDNQPFDIVIFDLTVPGGMGGKSAIAELRKHDPDIKAIVASGYSHDPVMAEPGEYGFQGVISKPFSLQALVKVILDVWKFS